jgi:hypothetical protein
MPKVEKDTGFKRVKDSKNMMIMMMKRREEEDGAWARSTMI